MTKPLSPAQRILDLIDEAEKPPFAVDFYARVRDCVSGLIRDNHADDAREAWHTLKEIERLPIGELPLRLGLLRFGTMPPAVEAKPVKAVNRWEPFTRFLKRKGLLSDNTRILKKAIAAHGLDAFNQLAPRHPYKKDWARLFNDIVPLTSQEKTASIGNLAVDMLLFEMREHDFHEWHPDAEGRFVFFASNERDTFAYNEWLLLKDVDSFQPAVDFLNWSSRRGEKHLRIHVQGSEYAGEQLLEEIGKRLPRWQRPEMPVKVSLRTFLPFEAPLVMARR